MKLIEKRGRTGLVLSLYLQDTRFSDGRALTGVVFNSLGLSAWYKRLSDSVPVVFSLSAGTVGTWSSGGFVEVSAAISPGIYELGVPDIALAAGETVTVGLTGAANMAPALSQLQLVAFDPQDAAALGLIR